MTKCPHCRKKFKETKAYAEHIIVKHPGDEVRVTWAQDVLESLKEKEVEKETGIVEEVKVEKRTKAKKKNTQGGTKKDENKKEATLMNEKVKVTLKKVFGSLATILAVVALLLAIWSLMTARTAGLDVQALRSAAATHGTQIAALTQNHTALRLDYNTLQSSYNALKAHYDGLRVSYNTLASSLDVVVGNVSTLAEQATNITLQLYDLGAVPNAQITYLGNNAVNVTVLASGNYSVYVALYGLNITNVTTSGVHYSIAKAWALNTTGVNVSTNTTLDTKYVVGVVPTSLWTAGDVIKLTISSNETAFAEVWCTKR